MSELSRIQKAVSAVSPNVRVSIERNCVVLSGELDDWDDVVACGFAAVSKKYLGVVNDIRLKGYEQKIRMPKVRDNEYDGLRPDVLIIGAGITGTTAARELAKYKLDVVLADKGYDVALGATSRNDGCVHVGIDLHPGVDKLKYVIPGNALYDDLCRDLNVKLDRTGHMILLSYDWERKLAPLARLWARILKIKGVRYVNREELLKIEPNAVAWAKGAFFMPSGGMVSPYQLAIALAENAAQNGVRVCLNTAVTGMKVEKGRITSVETNRGTIYPRLVINAAGTYADVIADMAGDRTFTIHPRKGTDIIMDKKNRALARTSMARMPYSENIPADWKQKENYGMDRTLLSFMRMKPAQINDTGVKHTKGGGVIHTVDDNVLLGPNAYEVPDREDFTTDAESIDEIFKKQVITQDKLERRNIIAYFAGERPATYEEDFVVRPGIFTENIIELAGIQSPGLTAAPAIAVDAAKWAVRYLGRERKVERNPDFDPIRKGVPRLADMGEEERGRMIRENPLYGEIVCRCEEVSKGEIIDALNSPVPVYAVDAIKRRVRPGAGRCQGGFCGPNVIKILAEQKGCSVEEITKGNEYGTILLNKTKKGANG